MAGPNSQFDFSSYFLTQFCQGVNLSSIYKFVPDFYSRFSLYHHFCLFILPLLVQAVNGSSTDKFLDHLSRISFCLLLMSLHSILLDIFLALMNLFSTFILVFHLITIFIPMHHPYLFRLRMFSALINLLITVSIIVLAHRIYFIL